VTDSAGVLVLNSGSSSVKLALVDPDTGARAVSATAERVGTPDASIRIRSDGRDDEVRVGDTSHAGVVHVLLESLGAKALDAVAAVGHRVVHGGARLTEPTVVDDDVVEDLRGLAELAPLHAPANLVGIEVARQALRAVPHVAVFDTAFHRTLPPRAYRYAVPRSWYDDLGVRRFGFHGISHRYVSERAADLLQRPLGELRLVTAHLGNGCSATAVRDGVSVDTTMGFTPLEGLVMGTRSGDVDPGALAYVGRRLGLDLERVVGQLNKDSGLAALSGLGNDVREVARAADAGSADAQLALDVFGYRAAKAIAALAVPLGRLDALVFTGGIGENSAAVRSIVIGDLALLGMVEDAPANAANGADTNGRIGAATGPAVLVVHTDEEVAIARATAAAVGGRTS
jgi:acetate kinase